MSDVPFTDPMSNDYPPSPFGKRPRRLPDAPKTVPSDWRLRDGALRDLSLEANAGDFFIQQIIGQDPLTWDRDRSVVLGQIASAQSLAVKGTDGEPIAASVKQDWTAAREAVIPVATPAATKPGNRFAAFFESFNNICNAHNVPDDEAVRNDLRHRAAKKVFGVDSFTALPDNADMGKILREVKSILTASSAPASTKKPAPGIGDAAAEPPDDLEQWFPRDENNQPATAAKPSGTGNALIRNAESTRAPEPPAAPVVAPIDELPMAEFVEESPAPASENESMAVAVFDPNKAMTFVKGSSDLIRGMMANNILIPSGKDEQGNETDGDYGRIGGSKKPALFKSGAEKLCAAFGLRPVFEMLPDSVSNWDTPFFYFHYRCKLYRIGTGELVATANGSCNSKEDKYGWRWVEIDKVPRKYRQNLGELEQCPSIMWAFKFQVEKADTEGQYAKPAEYWQMFNDAINEGRAKPIQKPTKAGKMSDAWEIDGTTYRIPNPDVYSIVNTLDKMGQKRALVAAVLIGTAASLFFTQDIEDMPNFGLVA